MPGGKAPGPSVKDAAQYEALRNAGKTKAQAAAISNASVNKRKAAKKKLPR